MDSYTATAFKWTGTHYNARYDDSVEVRFTDNDARFEGGGDADEKVSIDGGPEVSTTSHPYCITCDFRDADGDHHVEEFNFFQADGNWYFVPQEGSAFTEGACLGRYKCHKVGWEYGSLACFSGGTRIDTPSGAARVEDLRPGDRVSLAGGGTAVLRRTLVRSFRASDLARAPHLRPVVLRAGALAPGVPARDLRVSRQHRFLVRSDIATRMFETPEVLVAAVKLVGLPGVTVAPPNEGVTYYQLVFDQHQLILANGAPAESFFFGAEAERMLSRPAWAEFCEMFPGTARALGMAQPARMIPTPRRQKRMMARHKKNRKQVLLAV